jgi:signal transduction histidine kinase
VTGFDRVGRTRLVKSVAQAWSRQAVVVRDAAGAATLLVVSLIPLGVEGLELGELHGHVPGWACVLLTIAQTIPLAARRWWSALALLIVGAGFVASQVTGADTGLAGLGLLVALYSCARHQRQGRFLTATVAFVVYAGLAAVLASEHSPNRPLDWFSFVGVLTLPWVLGEFVRRRSAEQSIRAERAADEAVAAARALLARDLHDIVTHHVTAMVIQAESAQYLPGGPDGDAERAFTFALLGRTGRHALTELRSLLGALDPAAVNGTSRDTADDIPQMVERLRDTGYPISLHVEGSVVGLPEDVAAAMRSVAREAVTNAMKHARGTEVSIALQATDDVLTLTVANALSRDEEHESGGRGIAGMTARVAETGGSFIARVTNGRYTAIARWTFVRLTS